MAAPAARAPEAGEPDDPRRLAAQFDLVQRELRRVQEQLQDLQDSLTQTQQAAATVGSLADAAGELETLVPIGAGVHMHARVDPTKPVLIPLGAGYAAEDTLTGARDLLQKRVDQLAGAFQQASSEAERLARTAGAINERLAQFQDASLG